MATNQATMNDFLKGLFDSDKIRTLGAPVLILLILAMMVLPLPAWALDMLFTFNILISLIVLIAALYTKKPLDFSSFPTILLVTTLLRLSLNVASTRVVLLKGHEGSDAAGKVIESFGFFLIGGNLTVGIIVFAILVVINFVVITKGAGRIAEVAARFTLDAMPGKQMAIDADLNAGLIDEKTAKARRLEISEESEFFGSMDGASKFVRGDAVAGIVILLINIVGGLAVGMLQYDLDFGVAGEKYILLAIGDGLVAQIPGLLISVAAGIVVSRVGKGRDVGSVISSELSASPQTFAIASGILGMLGMIPGMPNLPFIIFSVFSGLIAYKLSKTPKKVEIKDIDRDAQEVVREAPEASWEDVRPVEPLALEMGFRLLPLVERGSESELLRRVKAIRKKFTEEMGFLPPAVNIRDNLELPSASYRILVKGVPMAEAEIKPGMCLAIDSGESVVKLQGEQTVDPAFGMPAYWIEPVNVERAQAAGYTVVDAATVIATHVSHVLSYSAGKLIGRVETEQLLEHFKEIYPKVVEELCPKTISVGTFNKVLQNLIEEGISIRDMRTIMETLLEHGSKEQNDVELTSLVRLALSEGIINRLSDNSSELPVMVFNAGLENMIVQSNLNNRPDEVIIEPSLAKTLIEKVRVESMRMESLGKTPVLLVPDILRPVFARIFRKSSPNLRVISQNEVPENKKVSAAIVIE